MGVSSTVESSEAPFTAPPITGPPVTNPPVTTSLDYPLKSDYRCGVDEYDAKDNCGNLCEYETDCAPGLFCFGTWNTCYDTDDDIRASPSSPLPPELQPKSDFRCGATEVDARSNCKTECTFSTDCPFGESCWTTHNNYCHIMPDGHPQCVHTEAENQERRCGYDEVGARGFCGFTCTNEVDCWGTPGKKCFPVHLNLCSCFEQQDVLDGVIPDYRHHLKRDLNSLEEIIRRAETNKKYFQHAEEQLIQYLQEEGDGENSNNGISGLNDAHGVATGNKISAAFSAFKYKYIIGTFILSSSMKIVITFFL